MGMQLFTFQLFAECPVSFYGCPAFLGAKPELVLQMEREGGDWHDALNAIRLGYRAIGSGPKLLELAQRLRQRWVKRGRRVLVVRAG